MPDFYRSKTVVELVALARSYKDACELPGVGAAGSIGHELAVGVVEIFGSLPDWPCGWERAELSDDRSEIDFAGGARCTPEEAIAIGLDLFERGRKA